MVWKMKEEEDKLLLNLKWSQTLSSSLIIVFIGSALLIYYCGIMSYPLLFSNPSQRQHQGNEQLVVKKPENIKEKMSKAEEMTEMEKDEDDVDDDHYSIKSALAEVQRNAVENQVNKYRQIRVKNIFILATWRSGSSFFGEAMSSHPGIYYHYEPLMYFVYKELNKKGPELDEALQTLRQLSQCDYHNVTKYMTKMKFGWNLLTLNNKISIPCQRLEGQCFDPNFVNSACRLYPLHVFKVVRLRGLAAEELLTRFSGAQIIYLVRDPRGIYASRKSLKDWCDPSTPCANVNSLCESLGEDLMEIKRLQSKHPDKVQVIRFEDVALRPLKNFRHIFKKLGIPWHTDVRKYLNAHTHYNSDGTMSTVKKSKSRVDLWKHTLQGQVIRQLQTECSLFFHQLHYPFVEGVGDNKTDTIKY